MFYLDGLTLPMYNISKGKPLAPEGYAGLKGFDTRLRVQGQASSGERGHLPGFHILKEGISC